jgi:hypothetical protein
MMHGYESDEASQVMEDMAARLLNGLEVARSISAAGLCPECLRGVMAFMMLQSILPTHGTARIKEMADLVIAIGESQKTPHHAKH